MRSSSNPYGIVGGNSNNVSNGNAGISYLNRNDGSTNSNNGGRSAFGLVRNDRNKKQPLMTSSLDEIEKHLKNAV